MLLLHELKIKRAVIAIPKSDFFMVLVLVIADDDNFIKNNFQYRPRRYIVAKLQRDKIAKT